MWPGIDYNEEGRSGDSAKTNILPVTLPSQITSILDPNCQFRQVPGCYRKLLGFLGFLVDRMRVTLSVCVFHDKLSAMKMIE